MANKVDNTEVVITPVDEPSIIIITEPVDENTE